MNLFITLARKGKDFQILNGPEVPYKVQREFLLALRYGKKTVDADEVQMWSSSQGRIKRFSPNKAKIQHTTVSENDRVPAAPAEEAKPSISPVGKTGKTGKSATKAAKPVEPSTSGEDLLS